MQQCLISIVDILGTKGIWTEQSVDKYFEVIENVKNQLESAKKYFNTLPNSQFIEFDFATFSDTLIITLTNKGEKYNYFFDETIEGFSRLNLGIFQSYLADYFFLRGCISFGDIEKRGNHFIGPAIDDAAEYCDSQEMIGICFTPKASLAMKYAIDWNFKFNNTKIDKYVIEYLTPLKNKNQTYLFQINWINHFLEQPKENNPIEPLNQLTRFLSRRNIPTIALTKFSNTIDFFKFVEKNYS
ncbi:MAG TPA: hypothetical protein PLP23_12500 [Panacibacter sp.]|nr:hypothetical protein [Panacibacter sp.]